MALFSKKTTDEKKVATQTNEPALAQPTVKSAAVKNPKSLEIKIQRPLISEKAMMLSESNTYIFLVNPKVNKSEIKKEIENIYNVDVVKVNTGKISKEPAKFRGISSSKSTGIKKAMVTVKKGQKIEIFNK
jgi:large subunit ribosomal protein L23